MSRDDYIEVSERIQLFVEQYPTGSLQADWEMVERDSEQWLWVKAYAYRYPDDVRPGVGHAWEPVPGRTPFTKGSELMVGETSAWGRALAAIGIAVHRGIASASEIRTAPARADTPLGAKVADMGSYRTPSGAHKQEGAQPATAKQLGLLQSTMSKQNITEAQLADFCALMLKFELPVDGLPALSKAQASVIIDGLLKQQTRPAAPVQDDGWERANGVVEDDPWQTK
jgi:hypothetical protein